MVDISQQIAEIEEEIRKTPYHKGTEHHIGKLRARIARLNDKLYEGSSKKGGGGGGGYAVKKTGDASVALIGPPSAGKSTLLNKLTNAQSKVAEYAFTTVSVIPGMMFYKGAYIQIFDIPGIIEGASLGKGRGKEVISIARNSDLLIIMSDVQREGYIEKIITELEASGIRLNKDKPNVSIQKTLSGGIDIRTNVKQKLSDLTIKEIAGEFGIKNGEISIREQLSFDTLIDSFSTSRVYEPAIFVINKIDTGKSKFPSNSYLQISAEKGKGLDQLREEIWRKLKLVKVILENGDIIMKEGDTLSDIALKIGPDFAERVKEAKIWGPGSMFPSQEVSFATKVIEGMKVKFIM